MPVPGGMPSKPKTRVKAKRKPTYKVTVPDAKESTRSRRSTVPTPDQSDRSRSAPQKKHDKAVVEKTVRDTRELGKENKKLKPVGFRKDTLKSKPRIVDPAKRQAAMDKFKASSSKQAAESYAPVLRVLKETTRVNHAIAGAADAAVTGKSVPKAALKGIKNETDTTFASVLKHAGVKSKTVQSVGGFALDVGTDPTTYLTLGAGSVAAKSATKAAAQAEKVAAKSVAAKTAGQKATAQAVKQGATPKAAKAAGKTAVKFNAKRAGKKAGEVAALRKPTNNGLSIKFAGREVPGVTRVTSAAKRGPRAVARKTGVERTRVGQAVDRAQQGVRDASRNLASDFNPAIAPAGVDRALYQSARRSARTARAGAQRGTYKAGQRAIAFRKAIGEKNYAAVINAIETGTISTLPKELRGPAHELERDFAKMRKAELRSGLKVGDVTQRGRTAKFPAGSVDTDASSKALAAARRAEATAHSTVEAARQAHDIHQGRAEVLSRNVSGTGAEKAAERGRRKRKVKLAPKYAAGAHGVNQTAAALRKAEQDLTAATTAREAAEGTHAATKTTAAEHRRAQELQDHLDSLPKGYVKHLRIKPEETRRGAPSVGSKKVAPSFGKSRVKGTVAQKNAAEPGAYSTDIPEIYLNRGAESAVARAKAKLNQSMVAAGRKPDRSTPIKSQLGENETLYKVDGANLTKIDPKSAEAKTLPKDGRYVILNEKLISRTRGTVDAAAERSTSGVFFDRAQGVWKLTATQVNPGYHVRNLAGEAQNAYLAENPLILGRNAVQAARALRQLGRDEDALRVLGAKPKEGKYTDFVRTAESVGAVRAGQLGREVGDMLKGQSAKHGQLKVRRGTLRKPARVLKNVEDVFRLATYKGGIDRGLTPEMAMERASRNHFDYGDLTPLERKVLRRVAPFWTFSARNIPLQARTLLTRPGKFANYQKIRESLQNAFGVPDDWEQDLSDSEQRSAPFPVKINGKTYNIGLGPSGLPLTDLNEFPSAGNPIKQADEWMERAMSMLTPAAKTPVELWANMSFFFREPIEREQGPLVPAPSWVQHIPEKYRKQLGITSTYRDSRSGKSGWGAPAKLVYALGVLPGPIAFGNRYMTDSDRPGQSKTAKTVQYMGPRVRQNDPLTVRINRLYEEKTKITKRTSGLGQQNLPGTETKITAKTGTPEYRKLLLRQRELDAEILRLKLERGDKGLKVPQSRTGSSGRIKIPGAGGRVKVPGAGGRIKIP